MHVFFWDKFFIRFRSEILDLNHAKDPYEIIYIIYIQHFIRNKESKNITPLLALNVFFYDLNVIK